MDTSIYNGLGLAAISTTIIIVMFIHAKFRNTVNNKQKKQKTIKIGSLAKSIVWRNLSFFHNYIRSPFIQLFIVSLLSTFAYISLLTTTEQTNITLLGQYINLQTSHLSSILVITAYVIAGVTLIESLLSLLKVREKEIITFRSVGWKKKHIFNLYLKEISVWSFFAIAIGTAGSMILYSIFYSVQWKIVFICGLSFIGLYVIVLIIASTTIQYQLTKRLGRNVVQKPVKLLNKEISK